VSSRNNQASEADEIYHRRGVRIEVDILDTRLIQQIANARLIAGKRR